MSPKRQTPSNRPPKDVAPTSAEELGLLGQGYRAIAGLDEVGRGCLAGPVVAAAVVLKHDAYEIVGRLAEVRDSKRLAPVARERLVDEIEYQALGVGVGIVPHDFIDDFGIVEATRQAMALAIAHLPSRPDHLLIDYLRLPGVGLPQKPILYGDSLCLSIAAASIVAKVHRDRLMCEQETAHPGYGFAQNKGYGTPGHIEALRKLGPSGIHRWSFAPVKAALGRQLAAQAGIPILGGTDEDDLIRRRLTEPRAPGSEFIQAAKNKLRMGI